jgi:lipoic acid synthetase
VRPGAVFKRSLNILRWAKELQPDLKTKSGIMVGLGETREEVLEVMDALRESQVGILTIGQYLQPSPKQLPVERFITPEEFEDYRQVAVSKGFSYVESGPFVRSSYHAWRHSAEDSEQPSPLQ